MLCDLLEYFWKLWNLKKSSDVLRGVTKFTS